MVVEALKSLLHAASIYLFNRYLPCLLAKALFRFKKYSRALIPCNSATFWASLKWNFILFLKFQYLCSGKTAQTCKQGEEWESMLSPVLLWTQPLAILWCKISSSIWALGSRWSSWWSKKFPFCRFRWTGSVALRTKAWTLWFLIF